MQQKSTWQHLLGAVCKIDGLVNDSDVCKVFRIRFANASRLPGIRVAAHNLLRDLVFAAVPFVSFAPRS